MSTEAQQRQHHGNRVSAATVSRQKKSFRTGVAHLASTNGVLRQNPELFAGHSEARSAPA